MSRADAGSIAIHDDSALFREAVNYTTAQTAFSSRLIEKDYFCSVALKHLVSSIDTLVFRGGTCLAKVHAGFYRLSEDLDFVIPVSIDLSRAERSARARQVKEALAALPSNVPAFRVVDPWTGANNSTQHVSVLGYTSLLNQQEETIKIEVSLREPLLTPVFDAAVRTLLLSPVSGNQLVNPFQSGCLSRPEAYAEKFRAALTRYEIAIRDFYDVDHAVSKLGVRPDDAQLVALVRQKLAVPGTGLVDVSDARLAVLREQLESQQKPVLRDRDFAEFELGRAVDLVIRMAVQVRPNSGDELEASRPT